ncbi:MAG: hypothetical protein Q9183_006753 [Haloplaca sp. 2 TL-2023]
MLPDIPQRTIPLSPTPTYPSTKSLFSLKYPGTDLQTINPPLSPLLLLKFNMSPFLSLTSTAKRQPYKGDHANNCDLNMVADLKDCLYTTDQWSGDHSLFAEAEVSHRDIKKAKAAVELAPKPIHKQHKASSKPMEDPSSSEGKTDPITVKPSTKPGHQHLTKKSARAAL